MGATGVAVWPGLVGSVCVHGHRCMVGLACQRVCGRTTRAACFSCSVSGQCPLDLVVFCLAPWWAGLCRNSAALGPHSCHHGPVLEGQPRRRRVARSLPCLGVVRCSAHTFKLAAQPRVVGLRFGRNGQHTCRHKPWDGRPAPPECLGTGNRRYPAALNGTIVRPGTNRDIPMLSLNEARRPRSIRPKTGRLVWSDLRRGCIPEFCPGSLAMARRA
jgi:hypothetical protein